MLPAGSNNQTQLPFTGLSYPEGVAVDSAGSVYVADRGNNRVVKLPAVSTALALSLLNSPLQLAVHSAGNVYVADRGNDRVIKFVVAGCPG
jgi:serine/threonine protein kinase, bacterial